MARAKKQQTKTLEDALWDCRVALRGVGSLEKNRDAVISLAFLKFSGDKFERRRAEIAEMDDFVPEYLEIPAFYNSQNVFYLEPEARWSYLVEHAGDNDIAVKIDTAMARTEARNRTLKGALSTNLFSTLGAEVRSIKTLIDSINAISEERFHEEDLIGRVYEYFLCTFAAGATKEDGEFYTPACIVKLIAELIEPYEGVVYDPCCGSGGMFVQSHRFVESHHGNRRKISVVGQESNPETWRLCKMNLAVRGISCDLGDGAASTFTDDQHKGRKVDYIMANPPFNLKGWRGADELEDDPRWRGYAVPPASNANYAWILHMVSKLDVNHGVAGFLLANGALNADGEEYRIRRQLLENDRVEAIIVLPRDMFYTTDISVSLWIVNMNKRGGPWHGRELRDRTGEVLFCDLRTWDGNIATYTYEKGKRKKKVVLDDEQIERVRGIYHSWQAADGGFEDVPELCASARLEGPGGIREHDYALTPSSYIEFVDRDLGIDYEAEMGRIQGEVRDLLSEERASQELLERAFRGIGYGLD